MGTAASRLVLLAAGLCLVAGLVALTARSAVLDREGFADRAVGSLGSDEVADEIANRFTTGVIERSPGLVTLRPALEDAADEVVESPWFAAQFAAAVRDLHRDVFVGGDRRPSLRVPGMVARVRAEVARTTPVLATRLPRDLDPSLMSIGGSGGERALLAAARRADGPAALGVLALGLGLLGLLTGVLAAADRRRALWIGGLTAAGAGGVVAAGWTAARTLTLEGFDTGWGDAVVASIWGAYLGDLRTWGLALAAAGIVVAAAAARPAPRSGSPWAAVPAPLQGTALLAAGALVLADRELALDLAAVAVATVLLYLGARRLLAGRARLALPALGVLAVLVTASAGGPARAPQTVAAQAPAGAGPPPAVDSSPSKRSRGAAEDRSGSPRICFASMRDARAAAEGAAIPAGARVQVLRDGRVCARPG